MGPAGFRSSQDRPLTAEVPQASSPIRILATPRESPFLRVASSDKALSPLPLGVHRVRCLAWSCQGHPPCPREAPIHLQLAKALL